MSTRSTPLLRPAPSRSTKSKADNFDRLLNDNNQIDNENEASSIQTSPTLKKSSRKKCSSTYTDKRCQQEEDSRPSKDVVFGVLIYLSSSDHFFRENFKTLQIFLKLTVISSVLVLGIGLWIEFYENPLTFSGCMLRIAIFKPFPLHYALLVNGALGLVFYGLCSALFKFVSHSFDHLFTVMAFDAICSLWCLLSIVYCFGTNIIIDDELEEFMLEALLNGKEESPIWKASQSKYQCCGIESHVSWQLSNSSYPQSCCKKSCPYPLTDKRHVFQQGCLDLFYNSLQIVGYLSFAFTSLHFILLIFLSMLLLKLHSRWSYLRSVLIEKLENEEEELNGLDDDDENEKPEERT